MNMKEIEITDEEYRDISKMLCGCACYIDLTDKVSILKRLSIESEFDLWNTIEIKQVKGTTNNETKIIGFDIEFRK